MLSGRRGLAWREVPNLLQLAQFLGYRCVLKPVLHALPPWQL